MFLGIGLPITRSGAGAWYTGAGFAATDNADSVVKGPGLIADFRTGNYAITNVATGSISAATASEVANIGPAAITDLFTFTRAGSATYIDSAGTMQTAATDVLRFDYTNGVRQALLEGAATNLLLWSQEFDNASWTLTGLSATANSIAAPDGTVTADTLTSTVTGVANNGHAGQLTNVSVSTDYTYSVFLKRGNTPVTTLNFYRVSPYAPVDCMIDWAPATPTITTSGAILLGSSFTSVGGGWYRVSLAINSGTATQLVSRVYVRDFSASITTGDNVYSWGAQLETGVTASSYIATAGTAVTRAADSCKLTAKAAALIARTAAGAIVQGRGLYAASGAAGRLIGTNGSFSRLIGFNAPQTTMALGSSNQVLVGSFTAPLAAFGFCGGWDGSGKSASYNGATIQTNAFVLDTDDLGNVFFGRDGFGTPANGWYDRLIVYPFRPTNAAIVSKAAVYS